jgi:hypothetical protein
MLSISEAEAIRIAILHREGKAYPGEDIQVAVNKRLNDDGSVKVLITRSTKSRD